MHHIMTFQPNNRPHIQQCYHKFIKEVRSLGAKIVSLGIALWSHKNKISQGLIPQNVCLSYQYETHQQLREQHFILSFQTQDKTE